MTTQQPNVTYRSLAQAQWQQRLNDASSVDSSSASLSFNGNTAPDSDFADDGLGSSINASQPVTSHSASRTAQPNLQASEESSTRLVSDSNDSKQINSNTTGLVEAHSMPTTTANKIQNRPASLELTSSIIQGLNEHLTALFDTQLKPTVDRVNELGKAQNEMIRLQREMMGVMLSLILRIDSASPTRTSIGPNTNASDNAPAKSGASNGSGKGTQREIDVTVNAQQDTQAYTKELLQTTAADVASLMRSVASLSNRVDNLGEDVGLLVGSVLGISGSSNNSSRTSSNLPPAAAGVNDSTGDALQERPGKRRRVTFDNASVQTEEKCVLDRLGKIETDIQELLKKTKGSEPRKSDASAIASKAHQTTLPSGYTGTPWPSLGTSGYLTSSAALNALRTGVRRPTPIVTSSAGSSASTATIESSPSSSSSSSMYSGHSGWYV